MIDDMAMFCDGNCCVELYVCPYYKECEKIEKIAEQVGVSKFPMDWNSDEIGLVKEYYDQRRI